MATAASRNESVQRFLRTPQCSPHTRYGEIRNALRPKKSREERRNCRLARETPACIFATCCTAIESAKMAASAATAAAARDDAMLDVKKFILEVKRRPAIYDMNCTQYNDRNAKSDAWYEVCVAMVENWDELSAEERNAEEKILRNKWRNIRDYFMKELKAPKKRKAGGKGSRKRKMYSYHNELLFLVPNAKSRRASSKSSKSKSTSAVQRLKDELEIHEVIELETSPRVEEFNLTGVALTQNEVQRENLYQQQHQAATCEASLASFDNEMPNDVLSTAHGSQRNFTPDDDYDKMFLLSLVPSLRCVPEHMKLHIRIQIQQVIASAFHPSNHNSE